MFVCCGDFIDLYYFVFNICITCTRNYIIISGAARGRREYNKGQDRNFVCFEIGKKRVSGSVNLNSVQPVWHIKENTL